MDSGWAKKSDCCQNCETVRFKHKARGFCERCYYLVRKLEICKKWDLSDPITLKNFPNEPSFRQPRTFIKVKNGHISQIKQRLSHLKIKERKLKGPIDSIDIEYRLRWLAKRCNVKNKNLFFGIAGYIEQHFSVEQRKVLYELLNKIEENIAWEGIRYSEIFFAWKNQYH